MKKIVFLSFVILLVFLPAALGVSCQQQPAPTPTPSPSPTPSNSHTPSEPSPAPTPPQPAEVPHYEITLVSFTGVIYNNAQNSFAGEVRNDAPVALEDMEAVITGYNKQNDIRFIEKRRINRWVLPPGETSKFGLNFMDDVNAVAYRISFELPEPSILVLSAEPNVPTQLQKEP